jgi:hypothetical protein
MRFLALTAVAAVALLASPLTHARGPMVTQSADVIGPGECEAEGSLARDEFRFGRQQFHASTQGLRGACAVADGHQVGLRYERQTAGNERVHVFGIEGKSRLWKDEAFGGALSFDWAVAGTRGAFGQGNRYAGTQLGLAYTQSFGQSHKLHGNANVTIANGGERTNGWGLGYEYLLTPTVSLLAETYGQEGSKPTQAVGVRWAPSKTWDLGLMAARPRLDKGVDGSAHGVNANFRYRF